MSRPGHFTSRKELRYPQNRMLDGPEGLSGRFGEEILFSRRFWGPSHRLLNGNRWHFPSGHGGQGVKLTTHPYLVPGLRISGTMSTYSQMLSWRAQCELCFYVRTVTEAKL
jgi:hypothetical protein